MRATLRTMAMALAMLLLVGCAGFLRPDPGMVARQEARIALGDTLTQQTWESGDLRVNYSLTRKGDGCSLEGKVTINDSINNSFPIITKFFLYISFLDQDGRVLETVDISPVIPAFGNTPPSLPLRTSTTLPAQAKSFVFHYYGGFRANPLSEGGHWDINYFPFTR